MSAILAVRVTPRSAKPRIGEWKVDPGGRPFLEIHVATAPADGAANDELIKLLAKALGVARGSVRIISGETARFKRLEVALSEDELCQRLAN